MKKIKSDDARAYFQERVNTNVKALRDMADIVKRYPDQFKDADINKVRAFLGLQLQCAAEIMMTAVTSAMPAEFSFDMDVPSAPLAPARTHIVHQIAPHAPTATGPTRPKPIGRLVGTKEVVIANVPIHPPRRSEKPEPGEVPDKTGYIDSGFLED